MTDPELAREVAEKIYGVSPASKLGNDFVESTSALILAAFARTEDARRVDTIGRLVTTQYAVTFHADPKAGTVIFFAGGPQIACENSVRTAIDAARGETLGGDDNAGRELPRVEPPAIPSEPASRAIPITAGTVVPFPCWLYFDEFVKKGFWEYHDRMPTYEARAKFYHPDQPTAHAHLQPRVTSHPHDPPHLHPRPPL